MRSNSRGNCQQQEDADTGEDQQREERGFSGTEALEPQNTKERSYATPKRDSAGWISVPDRKCARSAPNQRHGTKEATPQCSRSTDRVSIKTPEKGV